MKYCSPRAIEPRIPSYTHTHKFHTLRAIQVRIAKPIFLNSAAISNATERKEIIVTEILKQPVILTSNQQTIDKQASCKLQNSNSVEILD